jgi:hypothetical protein
MDRLRRVFAAAFAARDGTLNADCRANRAAAGLPLAGRTNADADQKGGPKSAGD